MRVAMCLKWCPLVTAVQPRSVFAPWVLGIGLLAAGGAACGDSAEEPTVGPPALLGFLTEPGGVVAGQAIAPIRIEVRDADGHRVSDARPTVTLRLAANPGNAQLAGTTVVTAVNGIATFADLSLERAATGYRLAAEAPGLAGGLSAAFSVSAGAAAQLSFRTQPPATAEGQVAFAPIRVGVEDAFGNPVSGAPVSITLAEHPSGAGLGGTLVASSMDGEASFGDLSVALPGEGFVLRASSGAAPVVASEPFTVRLTFAQVNAGGSHTCGVTTPGFAYCWGINHVGQLGDGTTATRPTPVPVAGRLSFASLAVGAGHNCGLTTTGLAYCWGAGGWGRLGYGSNTDQDVPTRIADDPNFALLSAGAEHTCGATTANRGYCWGSNGGGRLGDSTMEDRWMPTPVAGSLSIERLSAGTYHTCGFATDGATYCWGLNVAGQLGDGTTSLRATPTEVAGGVRFSLVSAGDTHTCGVSSGDVVYCWGANGDGQLGDGTVEPRMTPTPVTGGLSFSQVDAGTSHTCGLTLDGTAYCWGSNSLGRLGDGTFTSREAPTPVAGGLIFRSISAGDAHTCGVTTGNVAYCWGSNDFGRLGDGSPFASSTPRRVVQ